MKPFPLFLAAVLAWLLLILGAGVAIELCERDRWCPLEAWQADE